jgi:hypothetical protein
MRPGSIEFDPVLADEVLERLADGDSLASICGEQGMPNERSVRRWARNRGDFGAKYAAARRLGYEKRADEMLEIADDSSGDWIESEGGGKVLNSVHVNRDRLMIDTRKWLLSKMLPKIYGDHLTVAGDPDQPIQHIVHQIDWPSLSDEEIEAIEMFARAAEKRHQIEPGARPELETDR